MKRNVTIAAVTAAVLIGGGTATALAVTGDDDGRDGAARAVSGDVTVSDAISAALRDTPGTAVSADLDDADDEGEKAAWEVDVLAGDSTWHSVRIDPATGKVLGSHAEDDDDTAEVRAALKGTSVTAAQAARAASAKGTVTSVDLDDDGSRSAVWDVETRSGSGAERDWTVDAGTGKVTADRQDDGDDSDSDSDDD